MNNSIKQKGRSPYSKMRHSWQLVNALIQNEKKPRKKNHSYLQKRDLEGAPARNLQPRILVRPAHQFHWDGCSLLSD